MNREPPTQQKVKQKAASQPSSTSASTAATQPAAAAATTQAPSLLVGAPAHSAKTMNRTTTGFFGLQATGQRVAFILDMSGSMEGARWQSCSRALAQTLQALQSDATFFVVLYSTGLAEPPGQSGWRGATFSNVAATLEWVASVHPSGGTEPRPAFERVFGLAERPSCIFFLTDGQFSGLDVTVCSQLQGESTTSRGSPWKALASLWPGTRANPTINTVTLDVDVSAPVLKEMAAQSGGKYVHASST